MANHPGNLHVANQLNHTAQVRSLNKSGQYMAIRDNLKDAVVRVVQER
jgi:hypothetical protein